MDTSSPDNAVYHSQRCADPLRRSRATLPSPGPSLVVKLKLPLGSLRSGGPTTQPSSTPTAMWNHRISNHGTLDHTPGLPQSGGAQPALTYEWPELLGSRPSQEAHTNTVLSHWIMDDSRNADAGAGRTNRFQAFVEDGEETDNEQQCNDRIQDPHPSSSKRQKRTTRPTFYGEEETPELIERKENQLIEKKQSIKRKQSIRKKQSSEKKKFIEKKESFEKNLDMIIEIAINLQAPPDQWMRQEMLPNKDGEPISAYEWSDKLLRAMLSLSKVGAGNLPLVSDALWSAYQVARQRRRRKMFVVIRDVKLAEERLRASGGHGFRGEQTENIAPGANELGSGTPDQPPFTLTRSANSSSSAAGEGSRSHIADEDVIEVHQDEWDAAGAYNARIRPSQDFGTEEHLFDTGTRTAGSLSRDNVKCKPAVESDMQHNALPAHESPAEARGGVASQDGTAIASAKVGISTGPVRSTIDDLRVRSQAASTGSGATVKVRWGHDDDVVEIDLPGRVFFSKRKATEHPE